MVDLSENLTEEITQHHRLLAAERGEYIPEKSRFDLKEILLEVCKLYSMHIRTPDRTIIMADVPEYHITTDRPMLRRVVGNMVLNALEAIQDGESAWLSYDVGHEDVCIKVVNMGEIPRDVQLRIFKRSFSTKSSSGRGIGTYSMKLFGERYLGGTVGFHCLDGKTEFFIRLPIARREEVTT